MKYKMCAPCLFGLEGIAADEFKRLGFAEVAAENGRVSFSGGIDTLIKANLWSRYSERILLTLAVFRAMSFEDLFQGVKTIPWENYIPVNGNFPVTGHSLNSQLASIPNCQKIIKKAVVERLKAKYNVNWFEETGEVYPIRFSIMKDTVTIYLDTSGTALHKRGYRRNANDAPIRETLAAAMVDLAHWRGRDALYDPFCGSGTILIEAALKAANRAPGIARPFVFEDWGFIPKSLVKEARTEALDAVRPIETEICGCDIDPACVDLARDNARKAGVSAKIRIEQGNAVTKDWSKFAGTIITNPPYGERLEDVRTAQKLYTDFAGALGDLFDKKVYVISSHDAFESAFGRKADKKRKLYNGMLKCDLVMYYQNGGRRG